MPRLTETARQFPVSPDRDHGLPAAARQAEKGGFTMETRVALLSIIVSDTEQTAKLNEYLHEAGPYIIGRMGIPYRKLGINIISVAMDAPQDLISALSGKIGNLEGISSKVVYSSVISKE